jgi:hypothetical protein
MLKHFVLIVSFVLSSKSVFSQNKEVVFDPKTYVKPDSITIANGSKISYAEFKKACDDAWNASFGKMNNEDKRLFEGVQMGIAIPNEEEQLEPEN